MNELQTSKQFQERVFERIRASLGELMTEDELKAVLQTAMQKAFFEPIRKERQYGGWEESPPYLVVLVRDEMKASVDKAAQQWLVANSETVATLIDKIVRENITNVVLGTINERMSNAMFNLGNEIRNSFQGTR